MQFPLKAAITAACLGWAMPVTAQFFEVDKERLAEQAKQDEATLQLYVATVATREFCKEAQPSRAIDIDASWPKDEAKFPADLIAFSKSPSFKGLIAERVKSLQTETANPGFAAQMAATCLALTAPVIAQEWPSPEVNQYFSKLAKADEIKLQLYVSIVAARDFCKETQPDRAKDIDANWARDEANFPARLVEFSKTLGFAGLIAERIKGLHAESATPEYAARMKTACDKM